MFIIASPMPQILRKMWTVFFTLFFWLFYCRASEARVGATLEECVQHYGKEVRASNQNGGITYHYFKKGGMLFAAGIKHDSVVRMIYTNTDGKRLSFEYVFGLIRDNGADLLWHFAEADQYAQAVLYGYDMSLKTDDPAQKLVMFAEYDLKNGVLTVFNNEGVVESVDHI